MVFTEVTENIFRDTLIDVDQIDASSFNPCDYFKFTTLMKAQLNRLTDIATLHSEKTTITSNQRVFAGGVDRVTGEVRQPAFLEVDGDKEVSCTSFHEDDIIFHKIGARIGRIGLADFDGCGENEYIVIRSNSVNIFYLLLALRTYDVLVQLPFRETARPRVKRRDIEQLRIPRLGELENKIGVFISNIFKLRKRAKTVLEELLNTFDNAISSKMPNDYSFLMHVQTLTDKTLDPGHYFVKVVEAMFPKYSKLSNCVKVIHPSTLRRGDDNYVVTASNYRVEGIVPEHPRGVTSLYKRNFAVNGDIILNRIISSEKAPWKATVLSPQLDYLKRFGLTVKRSEDGKIKVPISEDVFILRKKPNSEVPQHYLVLVLNSILFRTFLNWIMGGSTGMQVIRKTKIEEMKIPLLEEHIMKAFSVATKICLELFSDTLSMLVLLEDLFQDVVRGEAPSSDIETLIQNETIRLEELAGNAIYHANTALLEAQELKYEADVPILD